MDKRRKADMVVLDKVNQALNQALIWFAGGVLVAMILLTCTNIFMRLVWVPIRGTYELMGYGGGIVTAFALGYTQIKRAHVAVDILVLRFSKGAQNILQGVNVLICMIFFAVVAWQIAKYAATLRKTGEVTETLQVIYYPFTYGVALGCAVLSLVFLTDFLRCVLRKSEGER
jgi:TRAP-type C4-dicarboxylate transport system permease small subunit